MLPIYLFLFLSDNVSLHPLMFDTSSLVYWIRRCVSFDSNYDLAITLVATQRDKVRTCGGYILFIYEFVFYNLVVEFILHNLVILKNNFAGIK